MRSDNRKCDTCDFRRYDDQGEYCDNPRNEHDYGLKSIYGWCEHYEPNEALIRAKKEEREHSF